MPCGAQERRPHWTAGARSTPTSDGSPRSDWLDRPPQIEPFARSRHSRTRFCVASCVSGVNLLPRRRSGARDPLRNRRSVTCAATKASEPETYGGRNQKKKRYSVSSHSVLKDRRFPERSLPRDLGLKTPKICRRRGRASSQRRAAELPETDCGNWQIFFFFPLDPVCRLAYSEGAAMAVGSPSLHIGI